MWVAEAADDRPFVEHQLVDWHIQLAFVLLAGKADGAHPAAFLKHLQSGQGCVADTDCIDGCISDLNGKTTTCCSLRVIRLHDVVYASLSAQSWWTQADRDAITDKVCAYMGSAALDTDLAFWSAAINQRVKIQRLVEEGDRRPAFIYAMLSTWSPSDVRPALLADPRVDADLIAKGANLATPIATMALIETVEKLFLHDKLTSLRHAQQMLSQRIDVFDKLATAKGLTIKQQSEILHHKGKALVRLNREPEALGIFEGIMGGPQPLPETEIQIMRLLKKGDPLSQQRAIDIAKRIYNAATSNEPVSHSVFFAAVESGTTDLIIAHETLVTTMLIDAAELGVSQALQTMSTISRFLSREAPAVLNKLIAAIPPHVIEDLPVPQDRFAWADILFEASRIDGAPAESQRAESLSLFETLPPDRFHSQRHAELLLLMQRPLEARALLTKRDDLQDGPFAQRLMALAEHQLGNPTVALEWIDQAFKNLSPKQEKYRYEFHEHRFDILAAIPSTFAVAELERAIELSAAGKEQERLKRRLVGFLETQ